MGATRRRIAAARRRWARAKRTAKKKIQAGLDISGIPRNTPYCYEWLPGGEPGKLPPSRCCPFWDKVETKYEWKSGYCHLMEIGDEDLGMGLLWDQVKECGLFTRGGENDEYSEEANGQQD